jgi:hypothetical protein
VRKLAQKFFAIFRNIYFLIYYKYAPYTYSVRTLTVYNVQNVHIRIYVCLYKRKCLSLKSELYPPPPPGAIQMQMPSFQKCRIFQPKTPAFKYGSPMREGGEGDSFDMGKHGGDEFLC